LPLKDCIYRYVEGEFDLPATEEMNMVIYFTIKCVQNHKDVFCTWNRETSRLTSNISFPHFT
jgi:hypothetical protein